jgi:hypothetical protein
LSRHLRRFRLLSSESHAPMLGEGHARVTPRPRTEAGRIVAAALWSRHRCLL